MASVRAMVMALLAVQLLLVSVTAAARCANDQTIFKVRPGASLLIGLPAESGLSCASPTMSLAGQPSSGSSEVLSTSQFRYTAPVVDNDAQALQNIQLSCGAETCDAMLGFYVTSSAPAPPAVPNPPPATPEPTPAPAAPIGACATSQQLFQPTAGSAAVFTVAASDAEIAACSLGLRVNVLSAPSAGSILVLSGRVFSYTAPADATQVVSTLRLFCGVTPVCDVTAGFFIHQATAKPATPAPTPVPTTAAPTPVPTTALPACSGNNVFVTTVGAQMKDSFNGGLDACASPSLEPTSDNLKSAVFLPLSGSQFLFSASVAGDFTVDVNVKCLGALVCKSTLVFVATAPTPVPQTPVPPTPVPETPVPTTPVPETPAPTPAPLPACSSESPTIYTLAPGAQVSAALATPETFGPCSIGWTAEADAAVTQGAFVVPQGLRFIFRAPLKETQVVASATIRCGSVPQCSTKVGFFVTGAPPSPVAPTPAPPVVLEPTPAPPVTAAPPTACKSVYTWAVPAGSQKKASLAAPAELGEFCPGAVYRKVDAPSSEETSGSLAINIVGDFLYTAAQKETVASFDVDVFCLKELKCRASLVFTVFEAVPEPQTPAPKTPAPTPAPTPACPNVYYYFARPNVAYSNTLRSQPGEPVCAGGRSFQMLRSVNDGTIDTFTLRGDFTFNPAPKAADAPDTWVDFTFMMYCRGQVLCEGTAYVAITETAAVPQPTSQQIPPGAPGQTPAPPTNAPPATPVPPTFAPTETVTCQGTCNTDAWKASPKFPEVWDNTADEKGAYNHVSPRADGKPIDGVDVRWNNGLEIISYGKIGNVAARFPTFEPMNFIFKDTFDGNSIGARISPTSTAFDQKCLAKQSDFGMAEQVWKFTNLDNKTGRVGLYYASGRSWFQKFGGKHIQCDTFVDGCRYAPLLTPRTSPSAADGRWTVDVNNCDVTWKGFFTNDAIRGMTTRSGEPVWRYTAPRRLATTLYSEAVKPKNWLEPAMGYYSQVTPYDLSMDLTEWVSVGKLDAANSPFSIDVEYFEYIDNATADRAFGLNVLFFPSVPEGSESSYMADRHVRGFSWKNTAWTAPTKQQCAGCTGAQIACEAPEVGRSSFTADVFPGSACAEQSRIVLSKGPQFGIEDCRPNEMHIFNRGGFSKPGGRRCSSSYQNLTIRGVAPGSATASPSMTFEGKIELQLLLDNGNMPTIDLDLSLFVSRLSTGSGVTGSMSVCRSSPYWPVYDPLGSSLPDEPHHLSRDKPGFLCVDELDRDFGPTGWAFVSIDVDGVDFRSVRVERLTATYEDNTDGTIVLLSRDENGQASIPLDENNFWSRSHPFLNFRDLSNRLVNNSFSRSPDLDEVSAGPDFAFAFTPGAINVHTRVEVSAVVSVLDENGAKKASVTFREYITVDPLLTANSRYGPSSMAEEVEVLGEDHSIYALVAAAGIISGVVVVAIFFMAADNDRPLPTWVPRGKVLKNTLFKKNKKPQGVQLPVEMRVMGAPGVAGSSANNKK